MCRTRKAPSGHDEAGFSYLETVVVFVLVGIVLTIGLPSYRRYTSNQRALIAARTLASDLRVAQQEAVTRRADVTVSFVAADADCGSGPSYAVAEGATTLKHYCLPQDVTWASSPSPLAWDPTGTPGAGATLTVRSGLTGRTHNVWVAAQTGAITDDTR